MRYNNHRDTENTEVAQRISKGTTSFCAQYNNLSLELNWTKRAWFNSCGYELEGCEDALRFLEAFDPLQ